VQISVGAHGQALSDRESVEKTYVNLNLMPDKDELRIGEMSYMVRRGRLDSESDRM